MLVMGCVKNCVEQLINRLDWSLDSCETNEKSLSVGGQGDCQYAFMQSENVIQSSRFEFNIPLNLFIWDFTVVLIMEAHNSVPKPQLILTKLACQNESVFPILETCFASDTNYSTVPDDVEFM